MLAHHGICEISVILPTFNEVENIEILLERILAALRNRSFEILVIDDDSPDGTWKVAEEVAVRNPCVRIIRRVGQRGLVSALFKGMEVSQAKKIIFMDSDLSHPPEMIPILLGGTRAVPPRADWPSGRGRPCRPRSRQ